MQFESPWLFLLLSLIPLHMIFRKYFGKPSALRFSSVKELHGLPRSWRQRLSRLPVFLRYLTLVLLVIAIARPRYGHNRIIQKSEGLAIEMLIDRSSSMMQKIRFQGKEETLLHVVKELFHDFVNGDEGRLSGRKGDLIGVIAFARYADTICPLTLAHGALGQFMKQIDFPETRDEDGTAMGDAIALAASRLKKAEVTLEQQQLHIEKADTLKNDTFSIKSKMMILLTDGRNTAGSRHPIVAAELAKKWGVKIYAIGFGEDASQGVLKDGVMHYTMGQEGPDEKLLKHISEITNGHYFRANNAEALEDVYKKINELEKTDFKAVTYTNYEEKFKWPLLIGLCCFFLELILSQTLFRRLP